MNIEQLKKNTYDMQMTLLNIYNDANLLFNEKDRADGEIAIFESVLSNDIVYISKIENKIVGFISFNFEDSKCVINSLYVYREYQRKGVGEKLLAKCFECCKREKIVLAYLKVLKKANWSIDFYLKNGLIIYESGISKPVDALIKEIRRNDWSLLLYIEFK